MKPQRLLLAALLSLAACTSRNPVLTVQGGQIQDKGLMVFAGYPDLAAMRNAPAKDILSAAYRHDDPYKKDFDIRP